MRRAVIHELDDTVIGMALPQRTHLQQTVETLRHERERISTHKSYLDHYMTGNGNLTGNGRIRYFMATTRKNPSEYVVHFSVLPS